MNAKRKAVTYRNDSGHSLALTGGGMLAPGARATLEPTAYEQNMIDDGQLVEVETGGGKQSPTIPDAVSGERTNGEGGE
jgi:hypothetical protein